MTKKAKPPATAATTPANDTGPRGLDVGLPNDASADDSSSEDLETTAFDDEDEDSQSASIADGRPPLLPDRLFLSCKAARLGIRAYHAVFKEPPEGTNQERVAGLRRRFVEIADRFLMAQQHNALPDAAFYREPVVTIGEQAEALLSSIKRAPRGATWNFGQLVKSHVGLPLRAPPFGAAAPSVEGILEQLIDTCRKAGAIRGKTRGRPDHKQLATDLTRLWTEVTGQSFTKDLRYAEGKDPNGAVEQQFVRDVPQFVRKLMPLYEPPVTFSEIMTALKAVPVRKRLSRKKAKTPRKPRTR